jgi:hypothetical protein
MVTGYVFPVFKSDVGQGMRGRDAGTGYETPKLSGEQAHLSLVHHYLKGGNGKETGEGNGGRKRGRPELRSF